MSESDELEEEGFLLAAGDDLELGLLWGSSCTDAVSPRSGRVGRQVTGHADVVAGLVAVPIILLFFYYLKLFFSFLTI